MNEQNDVFEKAGPYIFMTPIVAWFLLCLPDMMDWFARF